MSTIYMSPFNVHVTLHRRLKNQALNENSGEMPRERSPECPERQVYVWTNFHQPGECVGHIWIYIYIYVFIGVTCRYI